MQKLTCPKGGASHLTFSADGDWLAGLGPADAPTGLYCWTRSRDWAVTGLQKVGELTGIAFHPNSRTLAYAAIVRSMWHGSDNHGNGQMMMSSLWRGQLGNSYPSVAPVFAHYFQGQRLGVPAVVVQVLP